MDDQQHPTNRHFGASHPSSFRVMPHISIHLRSFLTLVVFFGASLLARAGLLKPDIDYTHYDEPLQQQIVDRIQAKVHARLGEGRNAHDRYFIIPFAYENRGNAPEYSHSFMSVIRVYADNQQPQVTPGLQKRVHKNREFEAFTISWLPHDFDKNPNLCVFEGLGARVDPKKNKCPISIGRDFKLPETLQLAVNAQTAVGIWGPYEITKAAFDLCVERMRLLDAGKIKYRADDRLYRKDRIAINCFHAMAGLTELYPNGGLFGTGFKMWGINGTARVLIEYKDRATKRHFLLEPVHVKGDLYGYTYAPTRNGRGVYNPFRNASAYHR
jgi:hypothetical protein